MRSESPHRHRSGGRTASRKLGGAACRRMSGPFKSRTPLLLRIPMPRFLKQLVELPIRATCPRGGTVLDPFVGSGTTAVVALRLGRKAIGIDASADCLEFTKKRILEVRGQPATPRQTAFNHAVRVSHGRMR